MNGNAKRNEKQLVRLELKYCERCGRMWFRTKGEGQVYCSGCLREIAELPVPRGPARPAERHESEGKEFVDVLEAGALQESGGVA